jgi:hypothetical protein
VPEHEARQRSRAASRTDARPRKALSARARRTGSVVEPAQRRRPSRPHAARQAAASRTARPASFDLTADERCERFTLIEFVWDIASGVQPVILAERKLLH